MTPTEIETYCRKVTNMESDQFVTGAEIQENYLYAACLQVSDMIPCIETYQTDTTVASQQTYSMPTDAIRVQRVVVDGRKCQRITKRQWDRYEASDTTSQSTGDPNSYFLWGDFIYLYPVPNTSGDTIEVWSHDRQGSISEGQASIDIPIEWHTRLCNYVIAQMFFKDMDQRAQTYLEIWENIDKPAMMASWRKRKAADGPRKMETRKSIPETDFGVI